MMAVNVKRLNENERVWLDRDGNPIDVSTALAACNRPTPLSRRTQALFDAAGLELPGRRWFVLRVSDRRENDVDKVLEKAGVECWLPSMEVRPARRGRRSSCARPLVSVPIWPGYLFVRTVNSDAAWNALLRLDGVFAVLGSAASPAPIPDDIVLKLKARLEHDEEARDVLADAFKLGQEVRIEEGPFASFFGVVEALLGFDRAKVEVNIFGRSCLVDLELAQIRKLG